MKRSDVIDNGNIQDGDVIVGLASFGLATYEEEYNSGMGSNGLTSARHDVFHNALAAKYPEAFDPSMPPDLVYSGGKSLTDPVPVSYNKMLADGTNTTVKETIHAGKLVLSPTRTYAPVIKSIMQVSMCLVYKGVGLIVASGAEGAAQRYPRDGALQWRRTDESAAFCGGAARDKGRSVPDSSSVQLDSRAVRHGMEGDVQGV